MMGGMGDFYYFCKKTIIYTKLLFLSQKYEKSPICPIIAACLNKRDVITFEPLVQSANVQTSKAFQLFI